MRSLRVGLSVSLVSCLLAQESVIRTSVPLVVVPVSVTDERGRFQYDVAVSDFVVLDNGKPRPVNVEAPDSVGAPFSLVVLIQTSDISDSAVLKIKKVGAMIQNAIAGTNGSITVLTFADQVEVAQDFTNSDEAITSTFHNLKSVPTRKGRMLDAVAKGLELLAGRPRNTRSLILIIGESKIEGAKRDCKICSL